MSMARTKYYSEYIKVYMTENDKKDLQNEADRLKIPVSDLIRTWIRTLNHNH